MCPRHPKGGCGFARHGTYARARPAGIRIARWYCPEAHETFSLLPDCLASGLSATLAEVEQDVLRVEEAGSAAAAARQAYPTTLEVDRVQGEARRLRRWRRELYAALVALAGLLPGRLVGHPPTLLGWHGALGADEVLVKLRGEAAKHLGALPPPFGLGPRRLARKKAARRLQQGAGADPPAEAR